MPEDNLSKLVLLLAGGGLLAGLTWRRPVFGLFIYCGSVALDYLLGMAGLNTSGLFSVGQGMLCILFIVSLLRWSMAGITFKPFRGLFFSIGGFIAAAWISAALGIWPANSFYQAGAITAMACIPFILLTLIDRVNRLRLMMWAVGVGIALSAGIGFAQYLEVTGGAPSVESTDDGRGTVMGYRGEGDKDTKGNRYAGPTTNANGFGMLLMGGLPALYYLTTARCRFLARALAASSLALSAFALLLTMSRTHIIGFVLFLGFMTMFSSSTSWAKRLFYWSLALTAAAGFIFAISQMEGVGERLVAGFQDGGDHSTDVRSHVIQSGLRAWLDNPLFGIGLNNTEIAGYNQTGNAAHDIVSGLLGELGGVGTLMFVMVVWNAFKLMPSSKRLALNGDPELARIAAVVKAALLVTLLSAFGSKVFDNRALWVWISMCVVLNRLAEQNSVRQPDVEFERQLLAESSAPQIG